MNEVILRGLAASPGRAYGRVTVIKSEALISHHIDDVEILVVPFLTPNIVPIMLEAKAVISNSGGFTSHAANIARELGIPCVVATKGATEYLKDGDVVEVDGDLGTVSKK